MKKILFLSIFIITACESVVPEVKPGEIKHIPYSQLYAVGTDSTIVIIERSSGKITDVIHRFK